MPNETQIYKINGFTAYIRKHKGTFEARVRQRGVQANFCSKSITSLKERIRSFTAQLKPSRAISRKTPIPTPKTTTERIVAEWLRKKAATLKESSYKTTLYNFNKHCLSLILSKASSVDIQAHLSTLSPRVAQYTYILLSDYFSTATELDRSIVNPMRNVVKPLYAALERPRATKDEISRILSSEDKRSFGAKLCLYTGMRRGEIKTACIEGRFVVCLTGKARKGAPAKTRKIPIMHNDVDKWLKEAQKMSDDALSRSMELICPRLHFHDLRHTFASVCKECGIYPEAVAVWMGHSLNGTTGKVYTHFSDEFMLNESKKFTLG